MRPKRPHVARPDQVQVARKPGGALIGTLEPGYGVTSLRLGDRVTAMTDQEIPGVYNEVVRAIEGHALSWHEFGKLPTLFAGWGCASSYSPAKSRTRRRGSRSANHRCGITERGVRLHVTTTWSQAVNTVNSEPMVHGAYCRPR
jgi:hypothetical protein